MVRALGATYHSDSLDEVTSRIPVDIIIEATGVASVVFEAMTDTNPYGILCLTGVSPVGRKLTVDAGATNRDIVLENDVVVGSVNANLRHYQAAAEALARADLSWLEGLVTRRVPLDRFAEAFTPDPDDIKVVLTLTDGP
jgi:threonine dehydrogenase-like Zn-dependent dehydrogenase